MKRTHQHLHLIIRERAKIRKVVVFQALLKRLNSFMYWENPSSPNLTSVSHCLKKDLLKIELHICFPRKIPDVESLCDKMRKIFSF